MGANAKANLAKREQKQHLAQLNRPHVILGNKPGDDNKWKNCTLSKVLVTEQEIQSTSPLPPLLRTGGEVELPKYTNFGIGPHEKALLFETLPAMSTEAFALKRLQSNPQEPLTAAELTKIEQESQPREQMKADMVARIVDLRNANAKGIAYENKRRCIEAFSPSGDPNDTGRPEVQGASDDPVRDCSLADLNSSAAILTMRIRKVWEHLNKSKKDVFSRRSLRTLVHKRAKALKYLKRMDRDKYDLTLEQLGLEPASVEGELVV